MEYNPGKYNHNDISPQQDPFYHLPSAGFWEVDLVVEECLWVLMKMTFLRFSPPGDPSYHLLGLGGGPCCGGMLV